MVSTVLVSALGVAAAPAVERVVTTAVDGGAGSLRVTVANAEPGDVIVIPGSVGMVRLAAAVEVVDSVTIRGVGDGVGIEAADGVETVFLRLAEGKELALEGLLVRGAAIANLDGRGQGSVVSGDWKKSVVARRCRFEGNAGAVVSVESAKFYDCEFRGNRGIDLLNAGTLEMRGCLVEDNEGGIDGELVRLLDTVVQRCSGRAAILCCTGVFRRCLIADNAGTGLFCDPDPGQVLMTGCSVVRNGNGGMVLAEDVRATVMNTTVSGNVSNGYAAIDFDDNKDVLLLHCTVTDNVVGEEPWSAAIEADSSDAGQIKLLNCVVANNHRVAGDGEAMDISEGMVDLGGNVIGVEDPGLGGLVATPEGLWVHDPGEGSVVVDAGTTVGTMVGDSAGRVRVMGAKADAGAVESGSVPLADVDRDGMEDAWERRFGLDADDGSDATGDLDGDGFTNVEEFGARTDPVDARSGMRVRLFGFENEGYHHVTQMFRQQVRLGWNVEPGVEYSVDYSKDLVGWEEVLHGLGDDDRAPIGPGMTSGEAGMRWFHDELRPGYYRVRAMAD